MALPDDSPLPGNSSGCPVMWSDHKSKDEAELRGSRPYAEPPLTTTCRALGQTENKALAARSLDLNLARLL